MATLVVLSCLAHAPLAAAQEPPLVTDRPGNGNAARTVPAASLQLEASAAAELDDDFETQRYSAPTLLRAGLVDGLELRLGSSLLGIDASGSELSVHPTDTVLGTKVDILQVDGFELASNVDVALPTGTGPFESTIVNPEARLLASIALPAGLGLLVNAGGDVPRGADGRSVRLLHVVNLGYTLPVLEGALSLFVESFGRHPTDGSGHVLQLDFGVAYLVMPGLQLDVFTQHGLTEEAPAFVGAVGVSTRWGP